MYKALILDLRARETAFAPDRVDVDFCRIHAAADALEALNARLAQLQAENEELMDTLNGYCWCCVNAKKLEKAPSGSRIRTCEHLRENGVVASSGRRSCQHWKWRGAQGEGQDG